jgi:hypothetical protein
MAILDDSTPLRDALLAYYSTYDIANPDDPPWWVTLFPPFRNLWENPVAQRAYKRGKTARFPVLPVVFIGSLVFSLALNLVFKGLLGGESETAAALGFTVTVWGPIPLIAAIIGLRVFFTCLVGTSIRIRRRIENGSLQDIFPLPVSDSRIFFGGLFPSLVEGLVEWEYLVGLCLGLLPGFLIIWGGLLDQPGISGILDDYASGISVMLALIPLYFFMVFVFTFSSGLASIFLPILPAIITAIVQSLLILGLAGLFWMTWVFFYPPGMVAWPGLGCLLLAVFLSGVTWLTGRIGVMAFARYRRPGFYEPSWSSAAGMIT